MAKKTNTSGTTNRVILFLLCFFLGWLGIDKLYAGGTGAWKVALVKFLLTFCIIGAIWNIYDMICAVIGRYKLNPLK